LWKALPGEVCEYTCRDSVTLDVADNFSDTCECLIQDNFRRAPIPSYDRLVGIVRRADITRTMSAMFRG